MTKKNILKKLFLFRDKLKIVEVKIHHGCYSFNELVLQLGYLLDDFNDVINFVYKEIDKR